MRIIIHQQADRESLARQRLLAISKATINEGQALKQCQLRWTIVRSQSLRTIILYHETKPGIPCPDGIAAAWVAKQKYPDADILGCSYGEPLPAQVLSYQKAIILDFSFPLEVLRHWENSGIEVWVIDHHKTAMQDLSGFANAIFDMQESGASLTWKTLFPDQPIPPWLEYVRDRDLWNNQLPASQSIHEAVSFMGRSLPQIEFYCTLTQTELRHLFQPLGEKLLQSKRERVAQLSETATESEILGHHAMVVEVAPEQVRLVSDLCTAIYQVHPDKDFVCTYTRNPKLSRWNLSFRSDKHGGNFDVSQIARQFNGGGHRNAAGGWIEDLSQVLPTSG